MADNQRGEDGKEIALEARDAAGEKLFSPSVAKNKAPILEAFQSLMPANGTILEIGSGTGQHGHHICSALPNISWQPSDPDPVSRASITAWAAEVDGHRMKGPLEIFADRENWWAADGIGTPTGLVSVNMIHIAPYAAVQGLFKGAGALLPTGGRLFLYGPFLRKGEAVESNLRFDADLKRRDPDWGVRDLDLQITPLAQDNGLVLKDILEMPGNNLSVTFEKKSN